MTDLTLRDAQPDDYAAVAALWHAGWHEAHGALVPADLVQMRTLPQFQDRVRGHGAEIRVGGAPGAPLGLCLTKGDELYQLYVGEAARGTGLAGRLLADAERRMAAQGVARGWLACAIGNARAARFYEKSGWIRSGEREAMLTGADGPYPLVVWIYEKPLI